MPPVSLKLALCTGQMDSRKTRLYYPPRNTQCSKYHFLPTSFCKNGCKNNKNKAISQTCVCRESACGPSFGDLGFVLCKLEIMTPPKCEVGRIPSEDPCQIFTIMRWIWSLGLADANYYRQDGYTTKSSCRAQGTLFNILW